MRDAQRLLQMERRIGRYEARLDRLRSRGREHSSWGRLTLALLVVQIHLHDQLQARMEDATRG